MFICLCREIYKCKREGLDVSWLGMNSGDPHVQGWNCNSLTEDFKMQKQFIHELKKNYNENCFIQINLRLGKEHERGFEKLWDETIYFNSFSSNQRGLVVSLKDSLPAKNIIIENILMGDYMWLTFVVKSPQCPPSTPLLYPPFWLSSNWDINMKFSGYLPWGKTT